jgi:hypothetical protein
MGRLGFVDRDDLVQWGQAQGASADLPDLVRQLILETTPGVVALGFATGVGVFGSGWDGTAKAMAGGLHVPAGLSLWELSTRGDVNVKADEDFDKRRTTPDGTPTTNATYVAVSTRTWRGRGEWANAKRAVGRWRSVEALGVDDLDTWLQGAPVTHAWLSEKLGLQPHGLKTAQAWWDAFTHATEPALPAKMLLAGRDDVAEAVRQKLAGPGQLITISGASREDVLAFLAALAVSTVEVDGGALLGRAAFIDRVEAFRRWRDLHRPLLLAPLTDDVAADMGSGTAHHIVVPITGGHADHELPAIDAQAAAEALQEAGLEEELANEVGQLARLSLLAARRRIAVKPELHRPGWARPPVARLARRMILLGRFSENADADLAVVGETLGAAYDAASEELAALTVGDDPLLVRLAASIGVVSQIDAWLLVSGQLRKEDFEAFHKAAVTVLTESDPRQELPPEEQWQAGVLGKARAYSADLRHGLATTLALMGAYGGEQIAGARLTPREWAEWIIRQILEQADGDQSAQLWASLNDVIPLLAEAAPDEFITAVRAGLAGEEPLLAKLFTDAKDRSSLFGGNSHSGLLWALETSSWSPDRFGAVVDLVARWAEVDPGGSYANRPRATLTDFFRAWFPQASVGAERRLDVLDRLRERRPDVAWDLLVSLLPELHGHAMYIARPRFRDWSRRDEPTNIEVAGFYEAVTARAIADAGANPGRLRLLVDHVPTLPPEGRASLFDKLIALRDELGDEERSTLWTAMRAEAAKNHEFKTAVWALPESDLARLEAVADAYRPEEATTRLRWLFDEHLPSLPGVDRGDGFEQYASAIAQARAEAAGEIAAENDWEGIYAFAREVKAPWFLGPALAEVGIDQYEPELTGLLESDDPADLNLASSYFNRRFREAGWPWLERLLTDGRLSQRQRARLLLASDDYPAAWEHVVDDAVAHEFWREFRVHGLGADFPYVATVVSALYGVDRYGPGLDLLNLYLRDDSDGEWADLVAHGLDALLGRDSSEELRQLSQYGLRNLFTYLERVRFDEDRLARLEWAYLPAFEFEPAPPTLSRYLAANPSFFVDVLGRVFRPGDEDENDGEGESEGGAEAREEPDEQGVEIARNAYRLLSEWRTLPGRDGANVDGDVLRDWVERARAELKEVRRLRIGDNFIGKLFASSPPDADGSWPAQAIRELLESIDSQEIERGFGTEIFNSIGVTSRGVLDGGDQERDKSAIYRDQAERFVDRWPKTAALLRDAAEAFERLARDRDDEAERRRTGFDR